MLKFMMEILMEKTNLWDFYLKGVYMKIKNDLFFFLFVLVIN
jgi:hypothetical protein